MGQQQLLLIVLAIIVVAIAIAVSIVVFRQSAIDTKRDLVMNENSNLANMALQYYKKPATLGGGGNSFTGWKVPEDLALTPSGNYRADVFQDSVVIIGTGNDVVNGTDSVKVKTIVSSNSYYSVVIN